MVLIPDPVATHRVPFHVTLFPAVVKQLDVAAVHVIPLVEYIIVFPPNPTATQRAPFHAMPFPLDVKIGEVTPRPVHVIPLLE